MGTGVVQLLDHRPIWCVAILSCRQCDFDFVEVLCDGVPSTFACPHHGDSMGIWSTLLCAGAPLWGPRAQAVALIPMARRCLMRAKSRFIAP
jgi:hypothetical protein